MCHNTCSEIDRSVKDLTFHTDGLIPSRAKHRPHPPDKWEKELRILGLLLLFFQCQPYIPWIVPCPNSEIAACYHPSDLLKTVAQAVGTVLEKSTKNVGEKQGH